MKSQFKTWKALTIGQYKNFSSMKKVYSERELYVEHPLDDMVKHIIFPNQHRVVNLIAVTCLQLGLVEGFRFSELLRSASANGLKLGTIEMALQLRIDYDQPPTNTVQMPVLPFGKYKEGMMTYFMAGGGPGSAIGCDLEDSPICSSLDQIIFVYEL